MTAELRIGTRGSELALWQARHVAQLIEAQPDAPRVRLVRIRTQGDARRDVPLWSVGGTAFFTREIDRALLAGEIDAGVHSLKDLASTVEPGMALAAVLPREDPRDALLSPRAGRLADLPPGARVGTSSLRRRAFVAHARRDLVLLDLRGNVPTRIERLHEGRYDAIVLATAGLKRLGLEQHIAAHLDPRQLPPAVSQGAIGVCARARDEDSLRWLRPLDDAATRLATTAERALLRRMQGGCQVPLGALATLDGRVLRLHAAVCTLDGSTLLEDDGEATLEGDPAGDVDTASQVAGALGERVAQNLLERGAARIVAQQRPAPAAEPP